MHMFRQARSGLQQMIELFDRAKGAGNSDNGLASEAVLRSKAEARFHVRMVVEEVHAIRDDSPVDFWDKSGYRWTAVLAIRIAYEEDSVRSSGSGKCPGTKRPIQLRVHAHEHRYTAASGQELAKRICRLLDTMYELDSTAACLDRQNSHRQRKLWRLTNRRRWKWQHVSIKAGCPSPLVKRPISGGNDSRF
jgi:hypothetical protein